MKNQEIKTLLLDVAENLKKIATKIGEEDEEIKEVKDVKKEKKKIKLEDVRGLCSDKAKEKDGHNEEVKEIIRSYGVQTLSEIDSKYYEEIMERVKAL